MPIFAERLDEEGRLLGTRAPLEELLRLARADGCPLEIETYTFEALPEGRRARLGVPTLLDGLEREFRWAASVV